jgi:N-acylneuraminate cytidylyltransferase/CMP-N,N'-diacetyllegionaminic acid synthase
MVTLVKEERPVRRIATICARGGSKGLPGKNLRLIIGKSLIAHAIDQAREADIFDSIVVSSDADDILAEGKRCAADIVVKRPLNMATDKASKLPAIVHAVEEAEMATGENFDVIVDLDVTSPLRSAQDICGSVALFEEQQVSNVITGAPARKIPYFNLVELKVDGYVTLSKPTDPRIERRQDCPACYDMNAAVYVWDRDVFVNAPNVFYPDTMLYVMPEERSHDIDTSFDFDYVEFVMNKRAS